MKKIIAALSGVLILTFSLTSFSDNTELDQMLIDISPVTQNISFDKNNEVNGKETYSMNGLHVSILLLWLLLSVFMSAFTQSVSHLMKFVFICIPIFFYMNTQADDASMTMYYIFAAYISEWIVSLVLTIRFRYESSVNVSIPIFMFISGLGQKASLESMDEIFIEYIDKMDIEEERNPRISSLVSVIKKERFLTQVQHGIIVLHKSNTWEKI
jgi:hypothetical protein